MCFKLDNSSKYFPSACHQSVICVQVMGGLMFSGVGNMKRLLSAAVRSNIISLFSPF